MKTPRLATDISNLTASSLYLRRSHAKSSTQLGKELLQKIDGLNEKIHHMESELAAIDNAGFSLQRDMVKHLVSSITDALIVVSPESTIESVNTAATKLTGHLSEDLIGKSLDILFPNEPAFHELALPLIRKKIQNVYNKDKDDFWRIVNDAPFGILMIAPDGTIKFANEISTSMFAYSVEELLGQAIHKLVPTSVAASHPEMMDRYFLNPEPRFIESNRDIQGRNKNGTNFSLSVGLVPLMIDERPYVFCICQDDDIKKKWPVNKFSEFGRVISEDSFWNVDKMLLKKDNSKIDVSISGALLNDKSSGKSQGILIIKDITEHKVAAEKKQNLEDQLRSAQKMETLGTMAGSMAHDFNNLLTPIIGHAELVLANTSDPKTMKEDVEFILKAANRAKDLVGQLFLCHGEAEDNLAPIDINEIIKEVVSLIRASTPPTINIETHLDSKTCMILADAGKIHQVIMNLSVNACQAMTTDGTLTITASSNQDTIELMVTDTGKGMREQIKQRIFDPFFTTKDSGTGLGLSVVQGIVSQYDGEVSVKSQPNRGSSFIVSFPKAKAETPTTESSDSPHLTSSCNIVIVDDEPEVAKVLETMLVQLGYRVTVFTSPIALIESSDTISKSDLILADYDMSKMNGLEMIKNLRLLGISKPTILMSASPGNIDREIFESHDNIKSLLVKPFRMSELFETVQAALIS